LIQAQVRMQQARRKLRQKIHATIVLQATLRSKPVRKEFLKQKHAAIVIQSAFRGLAERRLFKEEGKNSTVISIIQIISTQRICLDEKAKKRYHIVQELLHTEISYYEILCIIIDVPATSFSLCK